MNEVQTVDFWLYSVIPYNVSIHIIIDVFIALGFYSIVCIAWPWSTFYQCLWYRLTFYALQKRALNLSYRYLYCSACLKKWKSVSYMIYITNFHIVKVEWKLDIHMLSENGEDHEDLTVKVWAKFDYPFLSHEFLKF